jgi:thiamine-monophosphate kinase
MSQIGELGELALIERICGKLVRGRDVSVGVGDDCAVVSPDADAALEVVLTSDPVICGVHFDADAPAELVGRKAVGRVLSDLAAMGSVPRWLLVNISAPASLACSRVDGLYEGAVALASGFDVSIVGGDVAEGREFSVHVFGVGTLPRGSALERGGAGVGDALFVTGALGGSLLSGRHLRVEPRVNEGIWLRGWASGMIDLSDGLASDLRHLVVASGVGCTLNSADVPLTDAARQAADERPPLAHALFDGEDFELLFTVPEHRVADFTTAWQAAFDLPVTRIGTVTDAVGQIQLHDADGHSAPLEAGGFRHFSASRGD